MKNIILYSSAFFALIYLFSTNLQAQPLLEHLNSLQKIERALAKGEIKQPEAIGYQVLAFFSDAQLPQQYSSDPDSSELLIPDTIMNQAQELLAQMPIELAARVYYYMIPAPYRPESVDKSTDAIPLPEEIPGQDWAFIDDLTYEIRVWYEKDNAEQLALALKIKKLLADEIIPAEKKLMNRMHIRDDLNNRNILVAVGIERGQPNGGDGKMDVYIYNLDANTKAWVQGYGVEPVSGVGCPSRPSYMAVNLSWTKTANEKKIASTIAHEYFHAIQQTFDRSADCNDYSKMDEGTATYMKHHVFPKYNDEHEWFFWSEDGRYSLLDADYPSWPFYYFLLEMQGIHAMLQLHETMRSKRAIESLNATLSGGFKKQWLEYAVYEWNQEPLMDGFKQWDNYAIRPGRGEADANGHMPPIEIEKVTLDANGQYRKDMNMELKPLTRDFYAFDVSGAGIRSIAIENPVFWNGSKVRVKALVRKRGQSQFDEILWENVNLHEYHYCLDKKDEDIDLIVLVIGNYQYLKTGTVYRGQPAFKVTNQGCYGLKGSLKTVFDLNDGGVVHHMDVETKNAVYKSGEHSKDGIFKNQFYLESATVTYQYNGSIGPCHGSASGQITPKTGPKETMMGLASYNVAPEAWGDYIIGIRFDHPFIEVTYVCPSPKPPIVGTVPVVLTNIQVKTPKHNGESRLKGEEKNANWATIWDFEPIRE